jgi:hypothetical protein
MRIAVVFAVLWMSLGLMAQADSTVSARYAYLLLDRQEDLMVHSVVLSSTPNARIHLGIKPYRTDMFDRVQWDQQSFAWEKGIFRTFEEGAQGPERRSWWHRKFFEESLIFLKQGKSSSPEKYSIAINPVLFLELGPSVGDIPYTYHNTRGVWVNGNFGKFSFYTMIGENQARFPQFYNRYYAQRRFVQGWGWRKGFKDRGHDFAMAMGEVSYTPNHYFNFTLGHGKHFWGEGYRSLWLSDFAMPYPFFKIETTLGGIKYINLWAVHADGTGGRGLDAYPNKYTAMHLLSWNITARWNVKFFEANVWGSDSTGGGGFNVHFLNPVIFYRTVELQAGFGGGNALAGLSSSYNLGKGFLAYGQFLMDDFKLSAFKEWRSEGHWLNFYAFQMGLQQAGTGKDWNHQIGLEWNRVNPFVYAHRGPETNYMHFNYPLAHPWGAGFREVLLYGQLRYQRYFTEFLFSVGEAGTDTMGINLGNDLTRSYNDRPLGDKGYFFPTGNPSRTFNAQWSVGYMLNQSTGMRFELGVRMRRERFAIEGMFDPQPFNWYFVGLRTPFFNRTYH